MVDLPRPRALVVLTRAPSAGGKSRLFAELGRAPDPALLTALFLDTLDGASLPRMIRLVAVTPREACPSVAQLVDADVEVIPQPEGDLGGRMADALAAAFARGASMAAVIGSDLPHITAAPLAAAFDRLAQDPSSIVLGPAVDGGYYLIAATSVPPVFGGIDWGSDGVLAATLRRAARHGIRVHLIEPMADVDSVEALRDAARSSRAPRCAAWLRALEGI